jgi:hypothetical protein
MLSDIYGSVRASSGKFFSTDLNLFSDRDSLADRDSPLETPKGMPLSKAVAETGNRD